MVDPSSRQPLRMPSSPPPPPPSNVQSQNQSGPQRARSNAFSGRTFSRSTSQSTPAKANLTDVAQKALANGFFRTGNTGRPRTFSPSSGDDFREVNSLYPDTVATPSNPSKAETSNEAYVQLNNHSNESNPPESSYQRINAVSLKTLGNGTTTPVSENASGKETDSNYGSIADVHRALKSSLKPLEPEGSPKKSVKWADDVKNESIDDEVSTPVSTPSNRDKKVVIDEEFREVDDVLNPKPPDTEKTRSRTFSSKLRSNLSKMFSSESKQPESKPRIIPRAGEVTLEQAKRAAKNSGPKKPLKKELEKTRYLTFNQLHGDQSLKLDEKLLENAVKGAYPRNITGLDPARDALLDVFQLTLNDLAQRIEDEEMTPEAANAAFREIFDGKMDAILDKLGTPDDDGEGDFPLNAEQQQQAKTNFGNILNKQETKDVIQRFFEQVGDEK